MIKCPNYRWRQLVYMPNSNHNRYSKNESENARAEKSTYLDTVGLKPSWDLLNLKANFKINQCFLRAVTSNKLIS